MTIKQVGKQVDSKIRQNEIEKQITIQRIPYAFIPTISVELTKGGGGGDGAGCETSSKEPHNKRLLQSDLGLLNGTTVYHKKINNENVSTYKNANIQYMEQQYLN